MQEVARNAAQGRREVDKLIKLWRRSGEESWVLLHIEIQGSVDRDFPRRMYTYHSRLCDRYARPVASFAVLTDGSPLWRPRGYYAQLWGCRALLRFPTVKLLDFRQQPAALEAHPNPFALVVQAQLAAQATRGAPGHRLEQKLGLTRRLYRMGLSPEEVITLYAFIDAVLALPQELEAHYHKQISEIEEEAQMRYVTTAEWIGMQKGFRNGEVKVLEQLLKRRFGPLPGWVGERLAAAGEAELEQWTDRLLEAGNLEELFG